MLGVVDGIEVMTFNPYDAQVNPYGLADWYRYLNIGLQPPLVAGSDKMTAASPWAASAPYAWLGERPFTYESWMDAVRNGNTLATVVTPLEFAVQGQPAGSMVALPAGGGTVDGQLGSRLSTSPLPRSRLSSTDWQRSRSTVGGALRHSGHASSPRDRFPMDRAASQRGSYYYRPGDIAAHTSAVQVLTGDQPIFVQADAMAVAGADRRRHGLRRRYARAAPGSAAPETGARDAEAAHNRLHQRLHTLGVFHRHTPPHSHEAPHLH